MEVHGICKGKMKVIWDLCKVKLDTNEIRFYLWKTLKRVSEVMISMCLGVTGERRCSWQERPGLVPERKLISPCFVIVSQCMFTVIGQQQCVCSMTQILWGFNEKLASDSEKEGI